jgi:hypothetical protein
MRISKCVICLVAILFVPSAPAVPPPGKELTVSVDLETARQRGPLQIVGFKMPEEMGDAPIVVLRNVSTKGGLGCFGAAYVLAVRTRRASSNLVRRSPKSVLGRIPKTQSGRKKALSRLVRKATPTSQV